MGLKGIGIAIVDVILEVSESDKELAVTGTLVARTNFGVVVAMLQGTPIEGIIRLVVLLDRLQTSGLVYYP